MSRSRAQSETAAERGRWSSRRKTEAVLRLLRGEALDALSRAPGALRRPWPTGATSSWPGASPPSGAARRMRGLRQGIRVHFGAYGQQVAGGLAVRHEHGSQFLSDLYQAELRFRGITSRPAFVRAPEGHGCAERCIRTRKAQRLWVEHCAPGEQLRQALLAFGERYHREWLIGRPGHRAPATVRQAFATEIAAWLSSAGCPSNRGRYGGLTPNSDVYAQEQCLETTWFTAVRWGDE